MFDKSANMSFVGVGIKKKKSRVVLFFWKSAHVLKKEEKEKKKRIRTKCIRASVPDINWTIALDFA